MEFSRIGTHTIRCVITEDEIQDLGYTLEEILGNTDKTQAFMNQIFDMAEKQFNMKFEMGIRSVRADFLPNHTVSLTFSENHKQQKVNDFVEQLLGYVNSMIADNKEKTESAGSSAGAAGEKTAQVVVLFFFREIPVMAKFAKYLEINHIPDSILYKFKNSYYLMMDLTENTEDEVRRLSLLADEYAEGFMIGAERHAYLREHADVLIKERAVELLKEI